MRIVGLEIKKRASYEDRAGELVGTCRLEGPTGIQELVLSSFAIGKIFQEISSEITETAKNNARMVKGAVDEAVNGPLLEHHAKIGE